MLYCISVVPDIEEDMHEKCRFDLHLRIRCHGNFSGMVRADADSQRKLPVFRDEGAAFCGEKARTHGAENMLPEAVFFRAARMRPETGWKMLRGMAKLQRERSTGNEHTL